MLQGSFSPASPVHSPTFPSQTRERPVWPPSQLAEHSDQSPHSVHSIVGKHGDKHHKLVQQ